MALVLLWWSRRENSRSVLYGLVAGVTFTDMLGTLLTVPFPFIVYLNGGEWFGGQAVCDFGSCMKIFTRQSLILLEGCMALERFVAMIYPYAYERHVTHDKVKYVLAVVWAVSAFYSCLPLMKFGRNTIRYPGTWCYIDLHSGVTADIVFSFLYTIVELLLITFTVACNVAVICVLLRMRRRAMMLGKASSLERRRQKMAKETQMFISLVGITIVFVICYSPLTIVSIINLSETVHVSGMADIVAVHLTSFNHIANPWVYLLFRRRLVRIISTIPRTVSTLQTISTVSIKMRSLVKRRKMRATRSVQCSQSLSSFQNPNWLSTSVCERLSSTKSITGASFDNGPPRRPELPSSGCPQDRLSQHRASDVSRRTVERQETQESQESQGSQQQHHD